MGSGILEDSAATAHLAGGIGIARWPAKRQRGDTRRLSNHGTAPERQRRWDSETATAARQLGDCAQQRRWRRWDSGDVLGSRHAIARITGVRHWDGRNCDAQAAVTPKDLNPPDSGGSEREVLQRRGDVIDERRQRKRASDEGDGEGAGDEGQR
ncbi:hypothetical protein BGW80DRAFT_1497357 [Lactifluus volemus]|nr:hypothetical protein BGW80DRAFT_1497357 [Lactifluus volemus]